ncbi:MAG: NAD(P)/FAD-dependent oxidoreductase [Planctomycetota bacterium]|jgi:glycine oxidase
MSSKKDVVIIGGGVIGCSIAYHLGKRGITSLILERESIAARASGKAWAVIVYPPAMLLAEQEPDSLFTMPEGETVAEFMDLYTLSYYRLADIAREIKEIGGMDIEYAESEFTFLVETPGEEQRLKFAISFMQSLGYNEFDWIPGSDLREIFPHINEKVIGGLNCPEFQVEPYKYTLGLAQTAEKLGAEVKQGDAVGFSTDGSRITSVKLASGAEIEADKVVIAMGPWSGQGTSWLGKEIPIQLNMEQCLRMEGPRDFPLHSISNGTQTVIPKKNGDIIFGMAGKPDLKDEFDASLSEEKKMIILEGVIDMLPDMEEAKLIEHRGDLQAWAPGPAYNKPVMGVLPGIDNCFVATRFGTAGILMSPGAGKVMADLIAGEQIPKRFRRMLDYISPARALSG